MGQKSAKALALLVALTVLSSWAAAATNVRGTLTKSSDGTPVITTAEGKTILLEGDEDTMGVLKDARLTGSDFEAQGEFVAPGRLRVGPIHTQSMWVWRDGKRMRISYWCALCSIREYTPGVCPCCQQEMALDLREDKE